MDTTRVDTRKATDELYPLWQLYERLGNTPVCFYDRNTSYACGQSGQDIPAREVLELRRNHPEECVRVGYFEEGDTRVLYAGEDSQAMRETLWGLGLPKDFSLKRDEGTATFCGFRDVLRGYAKSAPGAFEHYIPNGSEEQLESVLRKLVEIYSG